MTNGLTRYQYAVLVALRELELAGPAPPTPARVAQRVVGTQTAESVGRILRSLEHKAYAEVDRDRHGPRGAHVWQTTATGRAALNREAPR